MRGSAIALTAAIGGALLVPAAPLADEPPAPPTAALETASTTVAAGKTVTLDSSKSRPGTGAIIGHVWDLDGNGSFETDTAGTPTVDATPTTAGPLTVRVRVIDDGGLNADAKLDLTVTAVPKPEVSKAPDETLAPIDQPRHPEAGGQPAGGPAGGQPGSGQATGDPAPPPADPATTPATPQTTPTSPAPTGTPQPAPAATPPPALTTARMNSAPALLPPKTLADSRTTTVAAKAGTSTTVTAAAASTGVTIKNFKFAPASTSVHVGDTITWTNQDIAPHTATANDGSFNTGSLSQGKSGSHTFTKAGSFAYICSIHPSMKGTVTVAAASGGSSGGSGSGNTGGSSGSTTPSASGGLPQTGLNIAAVVLLAALLMGSGTVLRRRVH
jgi:plastocyanin